MAKSLSSTIFQNNAQSAVLVEDAYKVSTKETRNSMYDSVKGVYADAVSGIYSNKGSATTLIGLIKQSQTGNISRADMLSRALGAMGTSLPSLLGTLGGTIKNKISDVAGDMIGPDAAKTVDVIYNNLGTLVKVASVGNAEDLAKFVSELTGRSDLMQLINIEAESAIISAMATELMSFGIPGIVDDLIESSQSPQVSANAWAYISTDAINGSDLVTVNKVIDKIGLAAFIERNPDAVNMLLQMFFFGTNDTPDTYVAKRAELLATLVRINPNWSKYSRNGVMVDNLEPFSLASKDAKTLFYLAEPERSVCLLALSYKKSNVSTVIGDLYPKALVALSPGTKGTKQAVTPIVTKIGTASVTLA